MDLAVFVTCGKPYAVKRKAKGRLWSMHTSGHLHGHAVSQCGAVGLEIATCTVACHIRHFSHRTETQQDSSRFGENDVRSTYDYLPSY